MAPQKKRTINFTSDEKRILTELVLKYQDLVENKRTDATTNSSKLKGWIRLTDEFNTISTFCHRTHVVLKCCWENIKRQSKKDQADRKKKIFMTGGGKPPTPPPPSNTQSTIVKVILGPALKGISSDFDSDSPTFSENIETIVDVHKQHARTSLFEENNDNDTLSSWTPRKIKTPISSQLKENVETFIGEHEQNAHTNLLKEKNDNDTWSSWAPKNLKTPVSCQLKVPRESEEGWLKRRRPKTDCSSDEYVKEKIRLVKILQENAEKESRVRLAILEEQLNQEKIKTQKLKDS
ncbi:uncharacterized protein LOC135081226 [Ostrinia nubilalis]|uniref:uncharacterized protein LOC135081226 n=1 Tax=Ostrinia nubilalis TaxID=29057 RepID=UPI0030822C5F